MRQFEMHPIQLINATFWKKALENYLKIEVSTAILNMPFYFLIHNKLFFIFIINKIIF